MLNTFTLVSFFCEISQNRHRNLSLVCQTSEKLNKIIEIKNKEIFFFQRFFSKKQRLLAKNRCELHFFIAKIKTFCNFAKKRDKFEHNRWIFSIRA